MHVPGKALIQRTVQHLTHRKDSSPLNNAQIERRTDDLSQRLEECQLFQLPREKDTLSHLSHRLATAEHRLLETKTVHKNLTNLVNKITQQVEQTDAEPPAGLRKLQILQEQASELLQHHKNEKTIAKQEYQSLEKAQKFDRKANDLFDKTQELSGRMIPAPEPTAESYKSYIAQLSSLRDKVSLLGTDAKLMAKSVIHRENKYQKDLQSAESKLSEARDAAKLMSRHLKHKISTAKQNLALLEQQSKGQNDEPIHHIKRANTYHPRISADELENLQSNISNDFDFLEGNSNLRAEDVEWAEQMLNIAFADANIDPTDLADLTDTFYTAATKNYGSDDEPNYFSRFRLLQGFHRSVIDLQAGDSLESAKNTFKNYLSDL